MSNNNSVTGALKRELWKRYGDPAFPAEWNGYVHGGGKLSQRFWEYFKAIEFLELEKTSVVLEVGGGSPNTPPFFGTLLASAVAKVYVMDENVPSADSAGGRLEFVPELGNYESVCRVLKAHPEITHVSCVSVFEHIEDSVREGIVRAIDELFAGNIFAATLEFHSKFTFFDYQLTTKTVSQLFAPLKKFYLERCEAAPTPCENSYASGKLLMAQEPAEPGKLNVKMREDFTPLWYPLALQFVRG